jgi:hypothetical protein
MPIPEMPKTSPEALVRAEVILRDWMVRGVGDTQDVTAELLLMIVELQIQVERLRQKPW